MTARTDQVQNYRELSAAYAFLSRAFRDEDPDAALLEVIKANTHETGTDLDLLGQQLRDGLEESLARAHIAADHAACLLGMSAHPVSPFESVHTSERHLMMQDARDEVVAAYKEARVTPTAGLNVPEDHIAVELAFMSWLYDRLAEACDTGDETEAEAHREMLASFTCKHVAIWMPEFCDQLESRATTSFYRGAAQLLRAVVTLPQK